MALGQGRPYVFRLLFSYSSLEESKRAAVKPSTVPLPLLGRADEVIE
jgi:hypothetical protein